MEKLIICVLIPLILSFGSCSETKKKKAFKVFNEGVSFSIDAADAQEKGYFEKSAQLNKKAIGKFKETLKIDVDHRGVRSALAHCLYLDKQFTEAIYWFGKSNKTDGPIAINFRELGLSEIDIGQVKQGREAIEKAFELDTSKEIRRITMEDLSDIGTLAFNFGKEYIAKGNKQTGRNYQKFAVTVLIMAVDFDNKRKDILKKIAQYTDEISDRNTSNTHQSK